MDLIDMQNYSRQNGGFAWILIIVDVFTRFCWAYMLPKKTIAAVDAALSLHIRKYHPESVTTDNESAFKSHIVQALLEKEEVTHTMVDQGDHKALGIVGRCIQTIKNAIWRTNTHQST